MYIHFDASVEKEDTFTPSVREHTLKGKNEEGGANKPLFAFDLLSEAKITCAIVIVMFHHNCYRRATRRCNSLHEKFKSEGEAYA